jgi:hypothetical protein
MGLSYDELFPGRFLKSGLFKGKDVTLIIRDVRIEEMPDERGGNKIKGIISFERTPLELILNRTNGEAFKKMFTADCDAWKGKRVTLYAAPWRDPSGEDTTCIRVRGSPDIAANITYELRLARKKPSKVTLLKTPSTVPVAQATTKQAPPPPPPAPAPAEESVDPITGEVSGGMPPHDDADALGAQ